MSLCVPRQQTPEVIYQIPAFRDVYGRQIRPRNVYQRRAVLLNRAASRARCPLHEFVVCRRYLVAVLLDVVRLVGLSEPA